MKLPFRRTGWATVSRGWHPAGCRTSEAVRLRPAASADDERMNSAMAQDERAAKIEEENRNIRRLRFLVNLVYATIAQDESMTLDEAWEHVRALKGAAVAMFPGKE